MTDTTTQSTAEPPLAPKPVRFERVKIALGMIPEPTGGPSFIWLERKDAFMVAASIVIGVPLLGLSGLSLEWKLAIALIYCGTWPSFFHYFEGRELLGQMQGRGSIKPSQVSEQQKTAQKPFFGVMIAVFIWFAVLAVYVAVQVLPKFGDNSLWYLFFVLIPVEVYKGLWTTWVPYGLVEWLILIHAWYVTKHTNHIIYNIGNTLSQATPMAQRTERKLDHGG